ncbi:MAG: MoaD/ThiS family protein [Deltaproteobacteria bacterium]|nr:MoaD/ThiS family protein [Deltaproteobacteria bacterium]
MKNYMAMSLKVKYFVPFDQLMGKTESLQLPDGSTVQDLLTLLGQKYTGFNLASHEHHLVILLNGAICTQNAKLSGGDEISILTPQLGG